MLTDLLTALVSAFIELVVHMLAVVFSSTYLAKHSTGLKRVFYVVAALSALHLMLALSLPFTTNTSTFLLSPLFNWPAMLVALVLLVTSLVASHAVDICITETSDHPSRSQVAVSMLMSYGLALTIIFGGAAIWSAQLERKSLRQELCQAASGKFSDAWKDRADSIISLSERFLKRDARGMLPCQPVND